MKEIRLRPAAEADIAGIREYTRRTWGAEQASRYLRGLGRRFQEIACGVAVSRQSERNTRCARYRTHLIYFRVADTHVLIVRVLHERMDAPSHLQFDD